MDDRVQQILEDRAIGAATKHTSAPSAPTNRIHHDRYYGSYTCTDSVGSVQVTVRFANGEPVECRNGEVIARKYSNVD